MRGALLLSLLVAVCSKPSRSAWQAEGEPLKAGAVIPRVVAASDPRQSYALYLPKSYSAANRWPVVYVFDPLARGELALRQFAHAAEVSGFIVAASNNSRNGPWAPQIEAAQAMLNDTRQRLSIDDRRIYFAGFSGGARVSAQLALLCKCAAGVLLSGAGFPLHAGPSAEVKFSVFSAVGDADFNYGEVIPLQDQLEKAALPHWLRVFEGPHEWAPAGVLDEALAWWGVQAMKANLEPQRTEFIASQLAAARERAGSFEASGDLLAAWREYRQIVATFDTLADVSAARAKAALLAGHKAVRDGLKRERGAFEEQTRLSDEVLSAVLRPVDPDSGPGPAQSASELSRDLRQRSVSERRADRALVFQRALGGVFIGSIESGNAAIEKRDYALAARYFACAAEANPGSEWVFRQLAVARALSGDRKGAVEALGSARKLVKDLPSFTEWCEQEPAFRSSSAKGGLEENCKIAGRSP